MKHIVRHDVDREKSVLIAKKAFEHYQNRYAKYSPTAKWPSPHRADISFTAKGMTFQGSMTFDDGSIEMELEVPFIFRPFKNRAVKVVEKEILKWLEGGA